MNNMIEIIPLVGIKLRNQSIHLLDSKERVESLLGNPGSIYENSYYYFENELRIDFNRCNCVEFIEFLGGIDGKIQPQIYGVKAFEEDADTLYTILKSKNHGEIDDSENGYSYCFFHISVGIYRETIPDDVQEMIEDAKEDGEPMDAEDIEYEMKKATHWDTIGIGIKNYYR
ncbi:MAG: hypothetical protein Q4D45_03710 [Lachnospiraceae bacterium]|nr:hypothetical protein [Lachnospiraceae bacterium]